MSVYDELKKVSLEPGQRIKNGSYALVDEIDRDTGFLVTSSWMSCREHFLNRSYGVRRWLFRHRDGRGYNIASFIYKVESKLGLNVRTKVGPTQRRTIVWLNVSPWWVQSTMRRSLLTALLRSANSYMPALDNFEEAMFSNHYIRETEYAVRRFMRGHTKYTGKKKGWYSQFKWGGPGIKIEWRDVFGRRRLRTQTTETLNSQVRELLIKPDSVKIVRRITT